MNTHVPPPRRRLWIEDYKPIAPAVLTVIRRVAVARTDPPRAVIVKAERAPRAPRDPAMLSRAAARGWETRRLAVEQVLTVVQQAVFDMLDEAAQRGAPCPTNSELERACGVVYASSAVQLIEKKGRIYVEREQNMRVVTIIATGARTLPNVRGRRARAR
jgi:hypothetical protein